MRTYYSERPRRIVWFRDKSGKFILVITNNRLKVMFTPYKGVDCFYLFLITGLPEPSLTDNVEVCLRSFSCNALKISL